MSPEPAATSSSLNVGNLVAWGLIRDAEDVTHHLLGAERSGRQ